MEPLENVHDALKLTNMHTKAKTNDIFEQLIKGTQPKIVFTLVQQ